MTAASSREIPFNNTSTDDSQATAFLLGFDAVRVLDEFRGASATGRTSHQPHAHLRRCAKPSGTAIAIAIVLTWTSEPNHRTVFFLAGFSLLVALNCTSFLNHSLTHNQHIGPVTPWY